MLNRLSRNCRKSIHITHSHIRTSCLRVASTTVSCVCVSRSSIVSSTTPRPGINFPHKSAHFALSQDPILVLKDRRGIHACDTTALAFTGPGTGFEGNTADPVLAAPSVGSLGSSTWDPACVAGLTHAILPTSKRWRRSRNASTEVPARLRSACGVWHDYKDIVSRERRRGREERRRKGSGKGNGKGKRNRQGQEHEKNENGENGKREQEHM